MRNRTFSSIERYYEIESLARHMDAPDDDPIELDYDPPEPDYRDCEYRGENS